MSKLTASFLLLFASCFLVSCGGTGNLTSSTASSTAAAASVPVTMSMQDSPPAGVTVLSFQIQIMSAMLQPSTSGAAPVPLLVKGVDVDLANLQSEPAFLGSLNVPPDTYRNVTVAFTNPRMTIFNSMAAAINVGSTTCAAMAPCNLTPSLASPTIMVNTAPFPITLASNSPLGFLLHFDVNSSISSDLLTITPTVDLKVILPSATGVIHQETLTGTVTGVTSPTFMLQPGLGAPTPVGLTLPPTFLIKTDSNTKYNFVDTLISPPCTSNNFSCLAVGQTVSVVVNVMSDGSLLATQVSLLEEQNTPAFEGKVVSVDPTNNQFRMALMAGQWPPTGVPSTSAVVGVLVTVTVTNSTVFQIDSDGFTIPAGLSFSGIKDMIPGQTVEVQALPTAVSASTAGNPLPLTTLRVQLDETQVTAQVWSIDQGVTPPTAFLIGNGPLPPNGNSPPASIPGTPVYVQTIPGQTKFQNVSGVSGLQLADTVSVGGLLFNTGTTPTLVAEMVLKRISCVAATASGSTTLVPCVMQ